MADMTRLSDDVRRAQYAFDDIDKEFSGQWSPANALKRYDTTSPQYKAALKSYKELKPKYEAAKKALDAAKAAYEKASDAAKTVDTTNKATKQTGSVLDKAKEEYQKALDTEDADAIQATKAALDAARTAHETAKTAVPSVPSSAIDPTMGPVTPEVAAKSDYANQYTLQADGSVVAVGGVRQWLVTVPKASKAFGVKSEDALTPFDSPVKARDAFLSAYGTGNKLEGLKQQLHTSGWITTAMMTDGTWVKGVDDFISQYSANAIRQMKYEGKKTPDTISSFLAQKATGVGTGTGGSTSYARTITTRGDAKKMLDEYMTDLLGRPSTNQEQDDFYTQLHSAENKAVVTYSKGTTTGSVLTDADRVLLVAGVARKTLKGTDVDKLLDPLLTPKGSQAAIDIAALQKTAASYGIEMPAAEALKRVAAGLGQKDFISKQEERFKQTAIQLHPNLKEHITAGGTVAEVADQYAYAKQSKLGVTIKTSTQDKDVMDAVASGMTLADFKRAMQAKPEWARTEEAHNTAADFTNTILQSFGFGG